VDTVGMAGEGFKAHVAPGDRVESGQLLLSFDLEKVLRNAASLKTPVLLLSDGFEIGGLRATGPILCGEGLFEVRPRMASEPVASPVDSGMNFKEIKKLVAVGLEHGIHARPAASLKAAIVNLDASVSCQLGSQSPADARSPVALMSQGISYGDVVTVAARGPDAQQALNAVVSLLDPLDLDEEELAARISPVAEAPVSKKTIVPPQDGAIVKAQPASPGLSMGVAFALETWDTPDPETAGPVAEEKQKLAKALEAVRCHLQKLSTDGAGAGAEIAGAHLALLEDPSIPIRLMTCWKAAWVPRGHGTIPSISRLKHCSR
jgi:phosphotransferase system HPr (HPr) family protein